MQKLGTNGDGKAAVATPDERSRKKKKKSQKYVGSRESPARQEGL